MEDIIDPPQKGKYQLIYADPPWQFNTFNMKGKTLEERGQQHAPDKHYQCQDLDWIKSLPVNDWAAPNAILFMWVSDPLLKQAFEVMEAWGFQYKTVGFTWAKKARKSPDKWHIGLGFYTRANPEMCLLGRKGKKSIPRAFKGVRQLVVEPVREHSRKPDRVREDIVTLFGDLPRLEMFARTSTPGWDSWGNETGKFDKTTEIADVKSISPDSVLTF